MMVLLENFSTTLALCPGRNMIPLEVSHRAQTNPGTTRGDSWKSFADVFAPFVLPPLRDRPEDIRSLVHHFAVHYAACMHKQITAISEEFMKAVVRHSWPGNVRELQNLIERSVILSTSAVLSGSLPELPHPTQGGSKWSKTSLPVTLLDGQISNILRTLRETKGVIGGRNGAAVRLGLARTTLILQNEAAGYHSMVTKTWCGYLKLVWEPCARTRPARLGNSSTRPPSHEPCP
jgi:hypothetical protein